MWFYVFIAVLLIILSFFASHLIYLLIRVKTSSNKKISFYYEFIFAFTCIWSMLEDSIRWRNKLTTLQERRGQTAIVTGGGRGIGLEITRGLLKYGLDVTIGVRQVDKCQKVIEKLNNEYPDRTITVLQLDVSSLKSVREFAKEVSNKHDSVHLLINNAGILFGDYKVTKDGFESELATNYLGHFLLTHLLLENLKRAGSEDRYFSRIVNVSSSSHYGAEIFFDDINMREFYYPVTAYCQSKLAQLMSSHYTSSIMKTDDIPVRSYATHPGIVSTGMLDEVSFDSLNPLQYIVKTPAQGAVVILYACLSPELEGKSEQKLYSNCQEGFSSEYSKNKQLQKKLFDMTLQMLNVNKFGEKD